LKYLTNKSKIAFLTTTDVVQGKVVQKQSEPTIEYADEDNEGGEVLVAEAASDSVEAEPVAEEAPEENSERLDVEGLDC
jgi:hypothetical protein